MTGAQVDATRLDQVVTNLVDNALKYSSGSVEVRVEPHGGGVAITVADKGIGIDADALGHLFEPFGRAPNAGEVQGMGLGLYIGRQIVERHAGSIDVISPGLNRGATFRVWLPTKPEQTDDAA